MCTYPVRKAQLLENSRKESKLAARIAFAMLLPMLASEALIIGQLWPGLIAFILIVHYGLALWMLIQVIQKA